MKKSGSQSGIAVIVVVAIMVALIMVTTALLATVTRSTAIAKTYMKLDLCRLAILSGRAAAINNIKNLSLTSTTYMDNLHTGLNTANPFVYGDLADTPSSNGAYGIEPYAKNGILGRTYGGYCPVRPPLSLLASGDITDSKKYDKNDGGIAAPGLKATASFIDDVSTASGGILDFWQRSETAAPDEKIYYQYNFVQGYLKDLSGLDESSTHIPSTGEGASMLASYYAVCIQDLGGCLNITEDGTTNNYDGTALGDILEGIPTFPSGKGAVLKAGDPKTDQDIADLLGMYNGEHLPERLQMTPWGKTDDNKVPLCVFLPTTSLNLIKGMVSAVVNKSGYQVDVPAKPGPPPVAAISALVSSLTGDVGSIAGAIYGKRRENAEDIATEVENLFASDASKKAASHIVIQCLLGVQLDTDGTPPANSTDADLMTSDGTAKLTKDNFQKYGRLVAKNSSSISNVVVDKVDSKTVNPGPYFKATIQGALVNIGTGTFEAIQNYEFVYYADFATPTNNKIIYQRWYENE